MAEKTTDEKLDKLLALLTAEKVADATNRVRSQTSRLSGVVQSFRMNAVAASTALVGAIQEAGLPISEDGKSWLTMAVMAYTALILYSDTHRKIGA